jgi:hypothetical protein
MSITLILLGTLVLGLILLAAGVILILTLKNKLAGILVIGVGLVITLVTIVVFSFLIITSSVRG